MSNVEVERSIEAILMVVDEPVTEVVLAQVLERTVEEVEAALAVLESSYDERGFSLRKINGGWRFYSHPAYSAAVEKFVLDGQQSRLTQAALETILRHIISSTCVANPLETTYIYICMPGRLIQRRHERYCRCDLGLQQGERPQL